MARRSYTPQSNRGGTIAKDDTELYVIRKDYSGGQNNALHGTNIGDTQATVLTNADIFVPGQRSKRPGQSLIGTLDGNPGTGMLGFNPDGGSPLLVVTDGTKLRTWDTSTFTTRKSDFTSGLPTALLKVGMSGVGDVFVAGNGTDNWFLFNPASLSSPTDLGNTNTSPPKTTVALYYANRWWLLLNNNLYWSDAFPTNYAAAFDRTTNSYRVSVGAARGLIGIPGSGIIAFGQDQVWGVLPSTTPTATDIPQKIIDIGCVANETIAQVGDDIYFLASDGVRGVFRTQLDKLQMGESYPISYQLRDEFDSLSTAFISKACAVYFDNKYFISVPVNASTTNNQVWVYYPASQGWVVLNGWNISAWDVLTVNGQQRLYGIDSVNGKVYQLWTGTSDNGVAIDYVEESRKEDFQQPLVQKVGGTLKVKALSAGGYNLVVSVSIDDQDYTQLGTMSLAGNAPVLPIQVPFMLAPTNTLQQQFSLDSLGPFYQIRIKIEHPDLNGNDDITIYETNMVSYANAYQSEG